MRPVRSVLLLATLALWLVQACGGGGGSVGPDEREPTGIGPDGGTVRLGEEIVVEIPPGALSEPTDVRIERAATPPDLVTDAAIGQAYRVEPDGLALAAGARVTIRVPESARQGRAMSAVTILRSTSGAGDVVPAGEALANVQRTQQDVAGTTSRLGVFSAALSNRPPTVSTGANREAMPGRSITVVATGSDPEGDPLSFAWSFQSRPAGSSASLSGAGGPAASFTPDVPGDYVLQVTVSDGHGEGGTASVTITAVAPQVAVANAGADQTVNVGETVTLDGTASAGEDLAYAWRFVTAPGDAPALDGADGPTPSFVAQTAGEHLVELTVTAGSTTDRDTVRVTVVPTSAPTGSLSAPEAVYPGTGVVVGLTASDPDGDPVQVSWSLQAPGGSGAVLQSSGSSASFTPDLIGAYRVTARLSDGTHQTEVSVIVYGNAHVAGTYSGDFLATDVNGNCGGFIEEGDATSAEIVVDQPDPGTVILRTSAFSVIDTDMPGSLMGRDYEFVGAMRVGNEQGSVSANGRVTGTFPETGGFDLEFDFAAVGGICRVSGTMVGS